MTPADLTAAHDGKRIRVTEDHHRPLTWVGTYDHPGWADVAGNRMRLYPSDRIELLDQEQP